MKKSQIVKFVGIVLVALILGWIVYLLFVDPQKLVGFTTVFLAWFAHFGFEYVYTLSTQPQVDLISSVYALWGSCILGILVVIVVIVFAFSRHKY